MIAFQLLSNRRVRQLSVFVLLFAVSQFLACADKKDDRVKKTESVEVTIPVNGETMGKFVPFDEIVSEYVDFESMKSLISYEGRSGQSFGNCGDSVLFHDNFTFSSRAKNAPRYDVKVRVAQGTLVSNSEVVLRIWDRAVEAPGEIKMKPSRIIFETPEHEEDLVSLNIEDPKFSQLECQVDETTVRPVAKKIEVGLMTLYHGQDIFSRRITVSEEGSARCDGLPVGRVLREQISIQSPYFPDERGQTCLNWAPLFDYERVTNLESGKTIDFTYYEILGSSNILPDYPEQRRH